MIGLFDSGTGGLSIMLALKKLNPSIPCIYFADHLHFPYGERSAQDILEYAIQISQFLSSLHVSIIVVACNTATIASIQQLRKLFSIPFIGTVPAIKPACLQSKTKRVAVLLTRTASQGNVFHDLVSSWSNGVEVFTIQAPKLVEISEKQCQHESGASDFLHSILDPLVSARVDSLVLGSTHFIFLKDWINKQYPGQFSIFDPAEGVAKQTFRVLGMIDAPAMPSKEDVFYTSGDKSQFQKKIQCLLPEKYHQCQVINVKLP